MSLTEGQILRLVNDYIGCPGEYLGTPSALQFSYRSLKEFYPQYCDVSGIDPEEIGGTMRNRFIQILLKAPPKDQAKIIRGVFKRFPPRCTMPEGLPLQAFGEDTDCVQEVRRRECILREFFDIADKLDKSSLDEISRYTSSEAVLSAITGAAILLKEQGDPYALDRVHTAVHGFLLSVCNKAGLSCQNNANIIEVFGVLKMGHPRFSSPSDIMKKKLKFIDSYIGFLERCEKQK